MKKYRIIILLILTIIISACNNRILDLESTTEPDDETFYSSEEELEMALVGVYNSLMYLNSYSTPIQAAMDNGASDIGVARGLDVMYTVLGTGALSASNDGVLTAYTNYYTGVVRANSLIINMVRAKDVVDEDSYNEIKGQALTLRAYYYMYLTELFGDVPYYTSAISSPSEALLPRVEKTVIVDSLLVDLETAAELLPYTWDDDDEGKVTKGVALGLRARIALYNELYDEAAKSACQIMEEESSYGYSLYDDYQELFQPDGQSAAEIMFILPFLDGYQTNRYPNSQGSRNLGGYSLAVPTQSMIDSYEATDGLPIDESSIYDPTHPFDNRDPRLKASIITPHSEWAGYIFESHPDSTQYRSIDGTVAGSNKDCREVSWPGAFCGYLWKKYTSEQCQIDLQIWDDNDFALMRYAEILLTYAEAKIESGDIDNSVLEAINRIRSRAYGVDVSDTGNYPAITTTSQSELRKVIRRERKVELANEGFRLFDIRRWKIAEKVMPVTLYGQILDTETATGIPQIDDDCFVSYDGIESQYDLNTDSRFAVKRPF